MTEAVRIRDTWVHSILTTYFPASEANEGVVQVTPDVWSPTSGLRRLLIVLNPVSGIGKATKIMRSIVGPVLQEAGVEYEVLITEKQGHAHEVVRGEPNIHKRYSFLLRPIRVFKQCEFCKKQPCTKLYKSVLKKAWQTQLTKNGFFPIYDRSKRT